jgi:uncharacterized protein YcfJ
MKNRIALTLFAALVVGLFSGCAVTRPIADVAAGAGGAYLGNQLSHGDPVATAAGAAGGVIVSETLHYAAKTQSDKQQYWLYVDAQKQRNQVGSVRLYPVQLPEQRIDGVIFQPSTKLLRIEE